MSKEKAVMKNWQYPPWNKPETIYWFVSNDDNPNIWGFDSFDAAQQYVDIFGGHVEITRPDKQLDLFN